MSMKIVVMKFGGTSLANIEKIKNVAKIVINNSKNNKILVVLSAMSGVTNQLQSYIDEVDYFPSEETDLVMTSGEQVTVGLLSMILNKQGVKSKPLLGWQIPIVTDENHEKARILNIENKRIYHHFESYDVIVLTGFQGISLSGQITSLGRGGSDFSAAILAHVLNANVLEIWTDVSGMFTANPTLVKQATPIEKLSYLEAMELSHFGAKVLYPPTIQPSLRKEIPIRIKNTFDPENVGTLICNNPNNSDDVKGISHIEDISLITLEGGGMIGIPGFSKRLFETLSLEKINIVFITQASSEHSICVGVYQDDASKAKELLDDTFSIEIDRKKIKPIIVENDLAIIAVVGESMKNYQGLSGQMFSALGRNNVNVRAIAQGSSEKNISAVINKSNAKKALNTLHEQFFEEKTKQLNLFVTGVGNVGERFLAQIQQQREFLKENLKLNIKVIGIANSRKMFFDNDGIDLESWKKSLENGEPTTLKSFHEKVIASNHINSVFIDNTANQEVSEVYKTYLRESISVVTCNKIACASSFDNYKTLKQISRKYNASFLFETNVGAGLPIINTLKNLINSGDRVHKIQAVLSGSLNFVFNNFTDRATFHDVVAAAQKEGYTEPDPKIDLSGVDVARKILILARESGYKIELEDISNNTFLPEETLNTKNNEDFYASLTKSEGHFQNIYKEANDKDCRLKYVAEFINGKANVGLQHIASDHPFYNLEGSDNIVLFFTDRYPENPLIIKGAGAGADVTASGIFADVIRIANK